MSFASMEFQTVNMSNCDYLVIDCGYVNRLIPYCADMISATTVDEGEETEGHALMFFIDREHIVAAQPDPDNVAGTLLELAKEKKLQNECSMFQTGRS